MEDKSWRDTLEKRPEEFDPFVIIEDNQEKYMKQDNGWFEHGELPPVGIECEIFLDGGWGRVFIAGVSRGGNPVAEFGPGNITGCEDCKFRPIRTERDVLIDLLGLPRWFADRTLREELADAILAAGFKRELK